MLMVPALAGARRTAMSCSDSKWYRTWMYVGAGFSYMNTQFKASLRRLWATHCKARTYRIFEIEWPDQICA